MKPRTDSRARINGLEIAFLSDSEKRAAARKSGRGVDCFIDA